jgi:hypothetical protein
MAYLWPLYSVRITTERACGADLQRDDPYLARQLSVRKVVPTLTSKSAEIYPSMVGFDTGFYAGSGRGRTSSSGVLGELYCVAPWCLQRGATSEAVEEAGPPGPRGID